VSTYSFLRWLRTGIPGAIQTTEAEGHSTLRAPFPVTVVGDGLSVTTELTLLGPGDAIGLNDQQIIGRTPAAGTSDASPQAFAHLEFDAPDLPWRFTPFAASDVADADGATLKHMGTLTPWVCLVVVERRAGVSLTYTAGDLLPVLSVDHAADELPDLTWAHAWAHVQFAGATAADLATVTAATAFADGHPTKTLSRLVCPRLLAPHSSYIACVVPVWQAGRRAGLGDVSDGVGASDFAWSMTDDDVRLPVYSTWEFATGNGGGFEDLVRALKRLDDLGSVGQRRLDVSSPGWDLPDEDRDPAVLLGALRPSLVDWGEPTDENLADAITATVERVAELAPPFYGRWHAARSTIPAAEPAPWITDVNLRPGLRAAAGLGARVVQDSQETFMAAAWAQIGDVRRANQILRQAQMAVGVAGRMHRRRLSPLTPYGVLSFAGPVLSRIRMTTTTTTVWGALSSTCLGPSAFSGATRKMLRTRGPIGRRIRRMRDGAAFRPATVLEAIADRADQPPVIPEAAPVLPVDLVDDVLAALPVYVGQLRPGGVAGAAEAGAMMATLTTRARTQGCGVADVPSLAALVVNELVPDKTIPPRVRARLQIPPGTWDPADRIDPIMVAPRITTPLYGAVAAVGGEWMLSGVDQLPRQCVAGMSTDQVFVEAFLVGANHEMGRILLWRGYPTDQRATVFANFWDNVDRSGGPDITDIHSWLDSALGSHRPGGGPDRFVLVIRGDLIARFPGATIFLVKAEWVDQDGTPVRRPVSIDASTVKVAEFSGRIEPDITFNGFGISATEARGPDTGTAGSPAGWFVTFQEQPTEPRFGLVATPGVANTPFTSWRDLATLHVKTAGGKVVTDARGNSYPVGYLDIPATTAGSYLQPDKTTRAFTDAVAGLSPAWDGRSDSLAAICLWQPFRLYVHASDLLAADPNKKAPPP
jgi:hypothetical protein